MNYEIDSPLRSHQSPSLEEIYDDLCSRFLINIPGEELTKFERIFFQIEQAHWFYLDFYREKDLNLPKLSMKEFSFEIFRHCPFLQPYVQDFSSLFNEFLHYKYRVPVCGAIILNVNLDKCILVKGY
eukprot:Sdes_comp22174_c0_seq1m20686